MYRLFLILFVATGVSAGSFALGQQPQLESTVVEDMRPMDQAIAGEPTPEFTLLEETQPANQVAAPETKLDFTFLEDMEPASKAFDSTTHTELDLGIDLISFDQVFRLLPNDQQSLEHPATAPEVAVAPLPGPSAALARAPLPVDGGVVMTTQPATQPVIIPVETNVVPATETGVELGVQPTPAIQEADSQLEMDEVVLVDTDEALPAPIEMEDIHATTVASCDACTGPVPCDCQSKAKCWQSLKSWWHNTELHRLHRQNIGDPWMFCERPFGVCNDGFAGAMIAAGKADRAMLHHYDFVHHTDGSVKLTSRGHGELRRIANSMEDFPIPLLVESTRDASQDEARRLAVLSAVAQLGLPISADSIQIAADRSLGVSDTEAASIETIRAAEVETGASRTRPYRNSSGAMLIPFSAGKGSKDKTSR